jgi:drug/metabolite transporter, DME family
VNLADLAWLALGATALAYALFSRGLVTVSAERAVTILLAQPVAAAALAYLLLGQSLAPWGVAGIAVLSASVLVLSGPTVGRRAIAHR